MSVEYTTATKRREPLPVRIKSADGESVEEFTFTPPKRAHMVLPMLDPSAPDWTVMQLRWLEKGFGPDQWARLQEKAYDEEDDFDSGDLLAMMQPIMAAIGGRPTT